MILQPMLALGIAAMAFSAQAAPVILDTDIGDDIDDTWAVAMLLKMPELDVRLITVASDDTPRKTRLLAKTLQSLGRADIPIGAGPKTSSRELRLEAWLGGYELESYPGVVHEDGVQALIDVIMGSEDEVVLITIGPMTNVAAALEREPRIAERARVISMAGSVDVGYLDAPKPAPEWNVLVNPEAAQRVFAAPWEITLAPLDICGNLRLEGERYLSVHAADTKAAKTVIDCYETWPLREGHPEDASSILFDTVAIYLAKSTEWVEMETIPLAVTDDAFTRRDVESGRPVHCAMAWKDEAAFKDYLVALLTE